MNVFVHGIGSTKFVLGKDSSAIPKKGQGLVQHLWENQSSAEYVHKPELGKDLADLICHSEDTAKRSYFFQEKNKKLCSTSATLWSVLREDGKATSDEDEEKDVIRRCFKDEIERKKITIAIVREKKAKYQQFNKCSDLQLRDKVRYMIQPSEKSEGTVF